MIRIFLLGLLLTGLTGCGQVGPLYLPDAPPPIYVQKDAYRDSDEDEDDDDEREDRAEENADTVAPTATQQTPQPAREVKPRASFPLNPTPTMANPEN